MRHQHHLDLDAYFARVGWTGERAPTWATLRSLHLAHVVTIPFENIEVLLGGVPSLEPADLEDKLVRQGRGGYCFEHNLLFAAVLESLGFGVTRLSARVRMGSDAVRPLTHILLAVDVPGEKHPYIADVGFGSGGLIEPLPLLPGVASPQGAWRYRLVREGDLWLLQTVYGGDGWFTVYAFTLERREPVDYEVANWFVATHPRSPFRNTLRVQRSGPHERAFVEDRLLTVVRCDGSREERELKDDHEVLRLLVRDFGLLLPWDTAFPEPPARPEES
ncbi:arylamine N-acetyltransferase [Embleya sp. NBC_00896]|uniref:arylamine N-acetyltransferase family protein n=1 Tax=Embleya sp. NBC_00896 TaxID=2975961 RepID=UPI00386B45E2|nr:arylamine N-acetyltransferase [Embleya sp. NBC_00896]